MTTLAGDLAAAVDPAHTFRAAVGAEPEPWQRRVLLSTAGQLLLLCARQVGKSTATAVLASHVATVEPGALVLIISPSQRQSDELLAKCRQTVRRVRGLAPDGNSSELRFEGGSRIVSLPATEATTRGFSAARLLLIDEAARVPDEVYVGALPMVARDGRVIALSTPGARAGWFWEAWTEGDAWERHKVTAAESAQYPPERIERLRTALGARQYRAELLAEFVGISDSVFDPDAVEKAFGRNVIPLFGGK